MYKNGKIEATSISTLTDAVNQLEYCRSDVKRNQLIDELKQ